MGAACHGLVVRALNFLKKFRVQSCTGHYQGWQLPDFSLRSQTFCYTTDFSTTFLYMLKTKTLFAHSMTKPQANILEFKNFDSILQQKNLWSWIFGKASSLSWLLLCLGRPMASSYAYLKHFTKFPDFFETQCWRPWVIIDGVRKSIQP